MYANNLPSSWSFHNFRWVIQRHGIFGMTSIALKRNVKGLHFGFVYPHQKWGISPAIKIINGISCGSYRDLQAFVSHFPRGGPSPQDPAKLFKLIA